jgi:hypothetical protein
MNVNDQEIAAAILEMRDLLRLLAEPAIAERDRNARTELRRLTGTSSKKAKAALLMNGTRSQAEIVKEAGIHKGQLSDYVKSLKVGNLLRGDTKTPHLVISIPEMFFEADGNDESRVNIRRADRHPELDTRVVV